MKKYQHLILLALFWIVMISLFWGLDLMSKIDDRSRLGYGLDNFRLYSEQVTSALAVLLLIPLVYLFIARTEKTVSSLWATIPLHIGGWVTFAFLHFSLMIVMRELIAYFHQYDYVSDSFWYNYRVELKKDFKVYLAIIAIIYGFRLFKAIKLQTHLNSRQKDTSTPHQSLMVMTGQGEAIISTADIYYLSSAKNYVSYFTLEQEYLVRETLTSAMEKINSMQFIRVHRSHVVNLLHAKEIKKHNSERKWLILKDGREIPISRSYQKQLAERLKHFIK